MSKNDTKPVSRKADIVVQEYGNEVLIYDLIINKAFSLNETSSLVWQACDGNKTVSEISDQISRQLNSPVNEDFVWLALEQLKKENLIENESEVSMPFEGLSRREVIRRAALTSLVALPIVSSLIAPMAIHAQSAGAACTQSISGCTGTDRAAGCTCSPGSGAGTAPMATGGTSNCAAGLDCYNSRPITSPGSPGATTGNACCPSN